MLNVCSWSLVEIIQEKAVEIGALELLDQYLETHYHEDKLCNMVLHCVGSLADSGGCMHVACWIRWWIGFTPIIKDLKYNSY